MRSHKVTIHSHSTPAVGVPRALPKTYGRQLDLIDPNRDRDRGPHGPASRVRAGFGRNGAERAQSVSAGERDDPQPQKAEG
jgi:hypothetical protein